MCRRWTKGLKKRAKEIDARFEDEKKFQNFHLSLLEEVDVFRVKIRAWKEDEVDNYRVMWFRIYGVPSHAWNGEFFVSVANSMGSFICVDESTSKATNTDVASVTSRLLLAILFNYFI